MRHCVRTLLLLCSLVALQAFSPHHHTLHAERIRKSAAAAVTIPTSTSSSSTVYNINNYNPEQSTSVPRVATTATRLYTNAQQDSNSSNSNNSAVNRQFSKRWNVAIVLMVSLLWTSLAANAASISIAPPAPTNVISPPFAVILLSSCLYLFTNTGGAFLSILGNNLSQAASWYSLQLALKPALTKSVTAGVIGVMGDYLAQWLEYYLQQRKNKRENTIVATTTTTRKRRSLSDLFTISGLYSFRRGLSIGIDGCFISGPLMHYGYELFEHLLPVATATGGTSAVAALAHVVADSIILDSIFVASTYLVTGIVEGYRKQQLIPQFKRDYIPTLRASFVTSTLLMPVEFVCFRYLPLSFRVLAVNFIDVVWDAVISFMTHRNRHGKHQQKESHINNNNEASFPLEAVAAV